ncbi:MAG: hypothetical protein P8M32_04620 [Phycisphaerales bacterium]|nr:hypothetical protein [Phycisphaerales bacterium]
MIDSVLWSVGLPVVGAGVLLACCWWLLGLGRWPRMTRALMVIAIGGSAAASFVATVGAPQWPPSQKWHGVFSMAIVLIVLGLLEAMLPRREWAARVILATLAGLASVWLLPLPGQSPITVAVLIASGSLLVGMLDGARGGLAMPFGGWAAGAVVSVFAVVAGSLTLGLMAGAVSATCGMVIVLGLLARGRVADGVTGGGMALGGVLGVIAVTAWAYDYDLVPSWAWSVAGGGFVIACLLEIGSLGNWKGLTATVVRSILLVGPPVFVVTHQWDAVKGAFSV